MSKSDYLVHTSGKVIREDEEIHTYLIRADSLEEAQNIGKKLFSNEYGTDSQSISTTGVKFNRSGRAILAIAFMSIAIALSFTNWFTETAHTSVSFKPDFISSLFAVSLYTAYVVKFKGVEQTLKFWDLLLSIFSILLIAGFVKILLVEKNLHILAFEIPIQTSLLLVVAVILSWVGFKSVSAFCMLVIVILGIINITTLNEAMGFFGIIYILTSFFGVLSYISIEPSVIDALPYIRKSVFNGSQFIQSNVGSLQKDLVKISKQKTTAKKRIE
jgi:hypothetical protein